MPPCFGALSWPNSGANRPVFNIRSKMTTTIEERPIRSFADSNIQAAVNKALSSLPPDKTGAVIAFVDEKEASLATMAKLGEHWSVVMVGKRTWSGKLTGEAAVTFSW